MHALVTILTIPFPGNISIIKARLESEEIECFTKDDSTIQIDPLISNAVGGIKLQVKEEDAPRALEILYSAGYLRRGEVENPDTYSELKKLADRLPFFKKLRFELRLLIWLLILIFIIIVPIIWFATPTTAEKLTANSWCVDKVVYRGKSYTPNTTGIFLESPSFCKESITFNASSTLSLPGFHCNEINGDWSIEGNKLIISSSNTFKLVYNGTYTIIFSGHQLMLQSQTTTIYCFH